MSIAELLGENFLSSDYYQQALTHRSVSAQNYERLEYLGDSFLGFIIAEWLFENYPNSSEGDLTRIRSHLVKKDTLAEIAREHSLGDYLILGSGELKSGGVQRTSILADALEALIGATYLSRGYEQARTFVLKLYKTRFEAIPTIEQLKDAKTRLQELLQSKGIDLPNYSLRERIGKSGNETFTVECTIKGYSKDFVGSGKSLRRAEQQAAELAYTFIINEHVS